MSGMAKNFDYFTKVGSAMAKEATELGSKAASAKVDAAESAVEGTIGKCVSNGLIGVGAILGVGCGAYSTHKFCEEILDKFVEYFKHNSKIHINKRMNILRINNLYFSINIFNK